MAIGSHTLYNLFISIKEKRNVSETREFETDCILMKSITFLLRYISPSLHHTWLKKSHVVTKSHTFRPIFLFFVIYYCSAITRFISPLKENIHN